MLKNKHPSTFFTCEVRITFLQTNKFDEILLVTAKEETCLKNNM